MMSACGHRATEPPELIGGIAEPWSASETSGLYLLILKHRKPGSTGNRAGEGVPLGRGLGPRVTYPQLPHFIPLAALTWGRPVRRLARLGEQLLTEVKALRKMRLWRARASR